MKLFSFSERKILKIPARKKNFPFSFPRLLALFEHYNTTIRSIESILYHTHALTIGDLLKKSRIKKNSDNNYD